MHAIYTNHLSFLHSRLAQLRLWAPCTRRDILIEETETEIEEYEGMLHMEAECIDHLDMHVEVALEEIVEGTRLAGGALAVADARKVGAQMEAMAPGCGATQGDFMVWSVNVEMEDGAQGEIRLVTKRGCKSGSLRWINA